MYPVIALSITGLLTLFLGFSFRREILQLSTIFFILTALASVFIDWNSPGIYFSGMLAVSNFRLGVCAILLISSLFIVLLSSGFKDIENAQTAEYYALLQFSLIGAIMMVTYQNILMLFLGIEILSVSLYVLTGADKRNIRGNEAALKYFLMGAFATGIFLFGVAMIYGATGTMDISVLANSTKSGQWTGTLLGIGITFLMVGMFFKVSAAPFHWWTADVYEGAPILFTAYMSTIVKTAGFVAIFILLQQAFVHFKSLLQPILLISCITSLLIGNLVAIKQESFKRTLAFSSISHAGFMFLPLLSFREEAGEIIAFYSLVYSIATITAFGVLMVVAKEEYLNGRPNEQTSIFEGLFTRNKFLSVVLGISLLSLAGIPLTAGFWGKFLAFQEAASEFIWMLVIAVIASIISLIYYFRPIILSVQTGNNLGLIPVSTATKLVFAVLSILSLLLGIFPDLFRTLLG